jgi:hypothetical protein
LKIGPSHAAKGVIDNGKQATGRDGKRRRHRSPADPACAWLIRPSSTSWPASSPSGCANDGEAGTMSHPATSWRHISVYERPHGP